MDIFVEKTGFVNLIIKHISFQFNLGGVCFMDAKIIPRITFTGNVMTGILIQGIFQKAVWLTI